MENTEKIKMNKILSVIIPLYNSAQWLEKCLMSVLNQDISEEQMEIICVNDGSPDNSVEIARAIGSTHKGIIVLDQENQGPSGARNNGMRHATGKYLMFVDPDDYVEPNTFGGLLKRMEEGQLDMLRFNFKMVNERYEPLEKPLSETLFDYTPEEMSGAEFLAKRLDGACNIWRYIYRREIITKNGIWCYTGDYFDDTPWLPQVLLKAKKMNICDTVVYNYLERSDSLVNSVSEKSVQRKLDGFKFLLKTLRMQKDSIECPEIYRGGVMAWYDLMMGYSVLSMCAIVALYRYHERYDIVRFIKLLGLLPLRTDKMLFKQKRKARLANVNPLLLMAIIHYKNKW